MEVVTINLDAYDELLNNEFQLAVTSDQLVKALERIDVLEKALLETNVDEYKLKNHRKEKESIFDYDFPLENKKKLLEIFSIQILESFVADKLKELESEEE